MRSPLFVFSVRYLLRPPARHEERFIISSNHVRLFCGTKQNKEDCNEK